MKKTLFLSWQRSAIKEVNDWDLVFLKFTFFSQNKGWSRICFQDVLTIRHFIKLFLSKSLNMSSKSQNIGGSKNRFHDELTILHLRTLSLSKSLNMSSPTFWNPGFFVIASILLSFNYLVKRQTQKWNYATVTCMLCLSAILFWWSERNLLLIIISISNSGTTFTCFGLLRRVSS